MRKIQSMTLILGAMAAGIADSATTTTTFAVTSQVQATCSATATTLAFPAYTPGAGTVTNNNTISVKCTKNSPYTISLNGGATAGGTVAQRLMAVGRQHAAIQPVHHCGTHHHLRRRLRIEPDRGGHGLRCRDGEFSDGLRSIAG